MLLLETFRPAARSVIDTLNLNGISPQSIRGKERRLGGDELAGFGDAAGTPHLRIVGK